MKRFANSWLFSACTLALLLSVLVPRAAAQNNGSIRGQIMDVAGKPWVDIGVEAVNDQGAKLSTKTDKDGGYVFRNLKPGIYSIFVLLPAPNKPYESKVQVQGGTEAKADLNFKDIIAKQGVQAAEQIKKQ
jgi:hypothetical protein